MNTPNPLKFTIGVALLTYSAFMAAAVYQGAKLRAATLPITDEQLQDLRFQEKIADIQLQLAEDEIDTDAITLDDIVQSHLREMKHPHNALRCLTDNIYFEAGREPYQGKLAVAQVTMNRVADDFGGDTVCAVVYFKKISPVNGKKQAAFSWTLGRAWRARGPVDWEVWRQCEAIARKVLSGKLHSHIIGKNVEYYHADFMTPAWADHHIFVAKIGTQDFYE